MQLIRDAYQSLNLSPRNAKIGEQVAENEMKVVLNINNTENVIVYSKTVLQQLDNFGAIINNPTSFKELTERKITIFEPHSTYFELAASLILEHENLFDLLNEDSFDYPYSFEDLCTHLEYYHPDSKEKAWIKEIKETQLQLMPFWVACRVQMAFQNQKKEEVADRFLDDKKEPIVPALVSYAREIIQADYIPIEKKEEFFDKIHEYGKFDFACRWVLGLLKARSASLESVEEKETVQKQISALTVLLVKNTENISALNKTINLASLSMMSKFKLSQSTNPMLQEIAAEAKAMVEEYKKEILDAFITDEEHLKADLDRTDLLEYLIGPKGFLFDVYGIIPMKSRTSSSPFTTKEFDGELVYHLKNYTAKELENEIREDLLQTAEKKGIVITLSEPLIKEGKITYALSKEDQDRKNALLPILKNWGSSELSKEKRDLFFNTLIDANGLNLDEFKSLDDLPFKLPFSFTVKPESMRLLPIDFSKVNETTPVLGKLMYLDQEITFKIHPYDFVLYLIRENVSDEQALKVFCDKLHNPGILHQVFMSKAPQIMPIFDRLAGEHLLNVEVEGEALDLEAENGEAPQPGGEATLEDPNTDAQKP